MVNKPTGEERESQADQDFKVRIEATIRVDDKRLSHRGHQEAEKQVDRFLEVSRFRKAIIDFSPFLTFLATLAIFVVTYQYTQYAKLQWGALVVANQQSNVQFRAAQQPYVGLGGPDGKVAEFRPATEPNEKGTIALYFFNAGHTPALNFLVNIWSNVAQRWTQRHIERYTETIPGQGTGMITTPAPNIPAQSPHTEYLGIAWVPSSEELALIKNNQWGKPFRIEGTLEYCDAFGQYRCEPFAVEYQPSPIDSFTRVAPRVWCLLYPPDVKAIIGETTGMQVEILPRCEQPDERQEKQQ